ncbi:lipopolysaccharide biosynthesis protein [Roseomonas sp. JC162]|uniref:Lipopolysaccharide biosynthesis protein n=1 Tax=Neoroseomonas marina TaxID=1232220 RepID=A0A848ED99_9PROT|nr:rhamnan synthesis F family protein [Neoroseomonas marina]NMJ41487.1 lipopolysaccharide biosynthesis protein [Neoroseomonas marina]
MRDLLRWVARQLDRLAYYAYRAGIKLAQQPQVLQERHPQILSDEVCTPATGKAFAIVVKYAAFRVGEDFLDLLATLRRQGVNAVVVCNGRPRPAELEQLRAAAHRILIRPNVGRDMGAYRAASLHLQGLAAGRMLYFNDSIFYLRGPELEDMVGRLTDSAYDVVGTFENHEYYHHVGSFAFGVSGEVFADPRVAAFWERYKPYDLRPHAIVRGEIGLAECVKKAGYRIDVVYSAERLAERLDAMALDELAALLRFLPTQLRSTSPATLLGRPEATARALRGLRVEPSAGQAPSSIEQLAGRMEREALVNEIMRSFVNTSQVHFGFGVFHRVMGAPLVKKDLLARGVFLEHEIARILELLPAGQRSEILRELVTRGRPVRMNWIRRFKTAHGLV